MHFYIKKPSPQIHTLLYLQNTNVQYMRVKSVQKGVLSEAQQDHYHASR